MRVVQLPEPKSSGSMSFEEALSKQQAVVVPSPARLSLAQVGQLAWAGQGFAQPQTLIGVTAPLEELFPIKLYFALPDGVYEYNPNDHTLGQKSDDDVRAVLAAEVLGQQSATPAGCEIIIAGSARGLSARHGTNARRIMYLQGGQVAQNIQLQAISEDLGLVAVNSLDANTIRQISRLPRNLEPLYVILVGPPAGQQQLDTAVGQNQIVLPEAKRALLIVGRQGYRDEELVGVQRILGLASVQTLVASSRTGPLTGVLGGTAQATVPLSQVQVAEFDAIVFLGGGAALEFFNNRMALDIARQAAQSGKIVGAISTAPGILANAGLLRGVQATSFVSQRDMLLQAGAVFTGAPVQRDGRIVTASDPLVAPQFAQAVVEALSEQ